MTDSHSHEAVPSDPPGDGMADPHADEIEPLAPRLATDLMHEVADNIESVIVGQRPTIEHLITTLLARGHLLIEDVPGVGKTMLARSIARSVDCSFSRIQFTPDLLPTDITGVNVFNQKTREFSFRPGPIFGNIVLGDEINRAPPKTQSALLEAMEEGQVTVAGETHTLPQPFVVIATQNTVDRDRTYELPAAELDRFLKRIHIGYPDHDDEVKVLTRVVDRHPIESLSPVADVTDLRRARLTVAGVTVQDPIREYATRLAAYTRKQCTLGVSPRGTIALVRAGQARAILEGRDYVIPDDIQTELHAVFEHRIDVDGRSPKEVVDAAVERTTVP